MLLEKIGQLAVFLICAQTLVHFRAKESYEKYVKLLVSMMLLILLVEPIMHLFKKQDNGTFLEQVQWYEQQLQEIVTATGLENQEIQQRLQEITQRRVEEVAEAEGVLHTETEAKTIERDEGTYIQETPKGEKVQVATVEVKKIEDIERGAGYGKSEENP